MKETKMEIDLDVIDKWDIIIQKELKKLADYK